MSQQINCPVCNELNKIGENFCHNCGTELKLIEPTEPQSQTIFQDQYPTIIIKPTKPKKISNRTKILICIVVLLGSSVIITSFFLFVNWFI